MNPNKDNRRASRIDNRKRSKDLRILKDSGFIPGDRRYSPVRAQRVIDFSEATVRA